MKNIKIAIALIAGFVICSFIYETKSIASKPMKIYREGDSKVVVWENKGQDDKTWLNYQVEKGV